MHADGGAMSSSSPPPSFVSETFIAFHLNIVWEMHMKICLILVSIYPL
jgi:hypothetical protein